MNARLKVIATAVLLAALIWALAAPIASANFLMSISIDSDCGATTHTVTITFSHIDQDESLKLQGQVSTDGGTTWKNSGPEVPVSVPTGTTTIHVPLTILDSGTYRAIVVSTSPGLTIFTSGISNTVVCAVNTPTPTATSTSTPKPTSTSTPTASATPTPTNTAPPASTVTPTATATNTLVTPPESTSTPTPTNTPTPTFTPVPPSGGGGGGGGSSPKPAPTAVLEQGASPPPPAVAPVAPPPAPTPTVQVAGAQAVGVAPVAVAPPAAPPAAPAAIPPPPSPPCLETATVVPLLDQRTGEQAVDLATGLPMWLTAGDDSGRVALGMACPVQAPIALPATGDGTSLVRIPLALPATGDGSMASVVIDGDAEVAP